MDDIELEINRSNTVEFININPLVVALTPVEKQKQPAGGYKMVDLAARAPQTFRIIELGAAYATRSVKGQDGVERTVNFWLLGAYDAVGAVNDHWTGDDGNEWEIVDIIRPNKYEQRFLVSERGQARQ